MKLTYIKIWTVEKKTCPLCGHEDESWGEPRYLTSGYFNTAREARDHTKSILDFLVREEEE